MLGRDPFFEDFLRDPFFEDPFHSVFGRHTALPGLLEQQEYAMSRSSVPQRRGREVPIETSGSNGRSTEQPAFSIEEVSDDERAQDSHHAAVVEEPDEGYRRRHTTRPSRDQSHARPQNQSSALMHPFQAFFDHSSFFGDQFFGNTSPLGSFGNMDNLFDSFNAFGGLGAFGNSGVFGNSGASGNIGGGNSVMYSSSTFAQQGPDGVQYAKSHSSSYGPDGLAEHQIRLKDGRTGLDEMTISRHLGQKGRTVTRQRQADGTHSEQQSLHNITDQEAGNFDEEWTYEAERSLPMYRRNRSAALPQASRSSRVPQLPGNK